jgi:hypothetical protein
MKAFQEKKTRIRLKSDKNIGSFTWRPTYIFTVYSSTKYSVVQLQCKWNPLLRLHGSNQQLYIVEKRHVTRQ